MELYAPTFLSWLTFWRLCVQNISHAQLCVIQDCGSSGAVLLSVNNCGFAQLLLRLHKKISQLLSSLVGGGSWEPCSCIVHHLFTERVEDKYNSGCKSGFKPHLLLDNAVILNLVNTNYCVSISTMPRMESIFAAKPDKQNRKGAGRIIS